MTDIVLFHLDLRTLFLLIAGLGIMVAAVFSTLTYQGAGGPAGGWWAAGHGLAAVGYLLYALRGGAPDLLSVVLGNSLILAGAILILRALRLHLGQPFSDTGALLAFTATALLFTALTYLQPDTTARVVLVSVVGGAILAAAAATLLAPRQGGRNWGHFFTAGAFAVAGAAMLARAGLTLTLPPVQDLLGAPYFHGVSKAVLAVSVAAWSLGFLWLLTLESRSQLEGEVAARRRSEQRFRAIFDASASGIFFGSPTGRFQMVNEAFAQLTRRSPAELAGRHFTEIVHDEDMASQRALLAEVLAGKRQRFRREDRLLTGDRDAVWVDLAVSAIRDGNGTPLHLVGVANEIGERKRTEAQLQRLAYYDPMTGALNRQPFERLLEREQERLERYGSPAGLVMLDLDHFKAINDNRGHGTGDTVLQHLSELARGRLRDPDTLARWGGEEFMMLLPETDAEGAARMAEDLRRAVAEHPFPGAGRITASLGVAGLEPGETQRELLRRVDDALYAAKRSGRNRVEVADRCATPT